MLTCPLAGFPKSGQEMTRTDCDAGPLDVKIMARLAAGIEVEKRRNLVRCIAPLALPENRTEDTDNITDV